MNCQHWLRAMAERSIVWGAGLLSGPRRPARRRRACYRPCVETLESRTLLNADPVFGASAYTFQVQENVMSVEIGSVSASDPEGFPLWYYVDDYNSSGSFTIDGDGVITGPNNLWYDYETNTTDSFVVDAMDEENISSVTVTIQVVDVDDVPQFDQSDYTFQIAEDTTVGVTVGTVTATDPLGGNLLFGFADGSPGDFVHQCRRGGSRSRTNCPMRGCRLTRSPFT